MASKASRNVQTVVEQMKNLDIGLRRLGTGEIRRLASIIIELEEKKVPKWMASSVGVAGTFPSARNREGKEV